MLADFLMIPELSELLLQNCITTERLFPPSRRMGGLRVVL
jgi:hypothetical protein